MQRPYTLIMQALHVQYDYGVRGFIFTLFMGSAVQPYWHPAKQYSTIGAGCHYCSLLTTAFSVKASWVLKYPGWASRCQILACADVWVQGAVGTGLPPPP